MRKFFLCLFTMQLAFYSNAQTFRINIQSSLNQPVLDGRLLLMLSNNNTEEPRFQVNDESTTQMVFGMDIENWQPGTSQLVDVHAFGYPIERLKDVPAGDYYVQVLMHKYETFHLKNGHTVKLPIDQVKDSIGILLPEIFIQHP